MRSALFLFASLSLVTVACSHADGASEGLGQADEQPSASAPVSPAAGARTKGPGVATVMTHDARVSIHGRAGAEDLRVVVRKTDGTLVADGLSIDQLRQTDPTLHAIVTSAVASSDKGTYLDATFVAR